MVGHQGYWDRLASRYDGLFQDKFSQFEDQLILQRLRAQGSCDGKSVLEIGCGTGLGCSLVQSWGAAQYVGIDSSPEMLAIAKQSFPHSEFKQLDASHLSSIGRSFDYIIAINGVCSYMRDIDIVLEQIKGVGRPGSGVLLSFLNRWSLRRLLRGRYSRREPLQCRGGPVCEDGCEQYLYGRKELVEKMVNAGFKDLHCEAYALFGGVWQIGATAQLEKAAPFLGSTIGHALLVEARL